MSLAFEKRLLKETLLDWLRNTNAPLDSLSAEVFKREKVGSQQRQRMGDALFSLVRHWGLFMPTLSLSENPAWLRTLDEALTQTLTLSTGDLFALHEKAKPSFEKDPLRHLRKVHALPNFLVSEIEADLNAPRWHEFLHQMYSEAPLSIRINTSKWSREEALKLFAAKGARISKWAPQALVFDRRQNLASTEEFQKGFFEIQDEHSQWVGALAASLGGLNVLDMCAGAGGKALQLAELLPSPSQIFAYDKNRNRLNRLRSRLERSSYSNLKVCETLPMGQKFDLILIDAPCSGLGTLRRHPDRLHAFSESEAEELRRVQAELVTKARELLNPGAHLVYVTCTPRPQENIAIVLDFVWGKGLQPVDLNPSVKAMMGAESDRFLTLCRESPSAKLSSQRIEPDFVNACLTLGPSRPSVNHTSDTLSGDSFFVAAAKQV